MATHVVGRALPTSPSTGIEHRKGEHRIGESELLLVSSEEVIRRVLQRFHEPDYVPPVLPTVALELMAMSRRASLDVARIALAIEQDPMLAARVVRFAQSPLYAVRGQIRSVGDALFRLGLERLTQIVLEVSLTARVFRAPGYEGTMTKLRKHSQATAHIARAVSEYAAVPADYAFLCGLLHDVGIAATLIALAALPRGMTPPPLEEIWPNILRSHEEVSGLLGHLWGFTPELELVMGHHHSYKIGGEVHPLACVTFISGVLATDAGVGCDEEFGPNALRAACEAMDISPGQLKALRSKADAIARTVRSFD